MAKPFKSNEEINAWLDTQPRDIISVFAARGALRTVPFFETMLKIEPLPRPPEKVTLTSLRAIATTLSSFMWPNVALKNYKENNTAALVAYNMTGFTASYSKYPKSVAHATEAAACVASISYLTLLTSIAEAAVKAIKSTLDAAAEAGIRITFLNELSQDKDFIDSGKSGKELAAQKLWTSTANNMSDGSLPILIPQWLNLKEHLLSLDQDWEVWTDWYEDRLRGNQERPFTLPFTEEIEIGLDPENGQYGRVTFPAEDYKDPAKVNAQIKQLIEDYRAQQGLLEQDSTAETFGVNPDGQIARTTSATSSELTDTPKQRDWYKSLRQAALGLKDIGENALGRAARPAGNLMDALPPDISDAKVALLWPAANRLRKLKAANDRALMSGDDYHPNRLAEEVVDDIEQCVEVYNNLAIGDAGLSEKDKTSKGPQDPKAEIAASEAATQGLKEAIAHDLFTDEAKEVIEADIAEERDIIVKLETETELTVLEKLAQDNIRREKENAMRALILRVRESPKYGKIEDGALMAIGAGIIAYVASVWPALIGLVSSLF